jgi:hypothetical protein
VTVEARERKTPSRYVVTYGCGESARAERDREVAKNVARIFAVDKRKFIA